MPELTDDLSRRLTDLFMDDNPDFVENCRECKRMGGEKSQLVRLATRGTENARTVRLIMLMVIDRIWLEED